MKITATFSSLLIASAVVIAGCSAPPAADVNDTKPRSGRSHSGGCRQIHR
jgi:hypothetical protein